MASTGNGADGHGAHDHDNHKKAKVNAMRRHVAITEAVFEQLFTMDWRSLRVAKVQLKKVDLSGEDFSLESLKGLLHKDLHLEFVEVLNIANNELTDLSVLNATNASGKNRFARLSTLVASRNSVTSVHLDIESLTAVNLNHNRLTKLPTFGHKNIHRLLLAHNQMDGDVKDLKYMRFLRELDLSYNDFTWKPSLFHEQMQALSEIHLEVFKLWPNPFTEHFKEYQFLAVIKLDSLKSMDGFDIKPDMWQDIKKERERIMANGGSVDYSIFDVRVEDRKKRDATVDADAEVVPAGEIPSMETLIGLLRSMLDLPNEVVKFSFQFEVEVSRMFRARWAVRAEGLGFHESAQGGDGADQTHDAVVQQSRELVDLLNQVLGRFDGIRSAIVTCLTRLIACGNNVLAAHSAICLAEWIDNNEADLQHQIQEITQQLFRELRQRALPGVISINEDPFECYLGTRGDQGTREMSHAQFNAKKWGNFDDIAEAAGILMALGKFGSSVLWSNAVSPFRAKVLQPFLPALCRETNEVRGKDKPREYWQEYKGFNSFPDETAEIMEKMPVANMDTLKDKCAKGNFYGFVAEEVDGEPDLINVYFKKHPPQTLLGMRRTCVGSSLWVRPSKHRTVEPIMRTCETWTSWLFGLQVLVVATFDPQNAAACVNTFKMHETVTKHVQTSATFTDQFLTVNSDARQAFVLLLQLACNLLDSSGTAGLTAARYFAEQGLHKYCWDKAATRIQEHGTPLPLASLKELNTDKTSVISWAVKVVCKLASPDMGVEQAVVSYLHQGSSIQCYKTFVDVVCDSSVGDPVMLAAGLESIYAYLQSDSLRTIVGQDTLESLHHTAVLLPYIRGPAHEDGAENVKYTQLWHKCETKYALAPLNNDIHPRDAPALSDLRTALMHRVLLAIVKLIELFSIKAAVDPKLLDVVNVLNKRKREKLLIGPTTGLVNCPDWDVKIGCLKCIEHVIRTTPWMFESEEMHWLLRFLTPTGIGVGKQEDVLSEVLTLVTLLIENKDSPGDKFRQEYAKPCIREAFQMLRMNCKRDVASCPEEEHAKVRLSLQIVHFLHACSRPKLSGNLRPFLRRADFVKGLIEVFVTEDSHDRPSCRRELLNTWTGRSMVQVLMPLVTGTFLRWEGISRARALDFTADVLSGLLADDPRNTPASDELNWWLGDGYIVATRTLCDDEERADWIRQQNEFVNAGGILQLMLFAEKFFSRGEFADAFKLAVARVKTMIQNAQTNQESWFGERTRLPAPRKARQQDPVPSAKALTLGEDIEARFLSRLLIINEEIIERYRSNLKVFDPRGGVNSLATMSQMVAAEFMENQAFHKAVYEADASQWRALLEVEDQYADAGTLYTVKEAIRHGIKLEKPRQPSSNITDLLARAQVAHSKLKHDLVQHELKPGIAEKDFRKADSWAHAELTGSMAHERISKSIADFVEQNEGTIYDMPLLDPATLEGRGNFKYRGHLERAKDISRLIVDFPNPSALVAALTGVKQFPRFSVVKVKNRFKKPTGLGYRMVVVTVEEVNEGERFFCELYFVIRHPQHDLVYRRLVIRDKMRQLLRNHCGLTEDIEEIADCIIYQLESRALRHRDPVEMVWVADQRAVEVMGDEVFLPEQQSPNGELFAIEKRRGGGVIQTGDIVYLKSTSRDRYIDVSLNGTLHCRCVNADLEELNVSWVVDDAGEDAAGVASGAMSLFSSPVPTRKKDPFKAINSINVSTGLQVTIKAQLSDRYISVVPTDGTRFAATQRQRVRGAKPSHDNLPFRTFRLQRRGTLWPELTDLTFEYLSRGDLPATSHGATRKDGGLEQRLNESYMQSIGPISEGAFDLVHQEGGVFARPHPSFHIMAGKQAQLKLPDPNSGRKVKDNRLVASMLRSIYALLRVPVEPGNLNYVLEEMLGTQQNPHEMLGRVLEVVLGSQISSSEATSIDLNGAWLTAKMLKLFSVLLALMPAESKPPIRPMVDNAPSERRKLRQMEEQGKTDKQRLLVLDIMATYLREVLAEPLISRISIVSLRPLVRYEFTLLRELSIMVGNLVRAFFSNELRNAADPKKASDEPFEALGRGGHDHHHHSKVEGSAAVAQEIRIGSAQRCVIISQMLGRGVLHVLVHAMLHGMHKEALTFQRGDAEDPRQKDEDKRNIKLVSSLVNRSIQTIASVMYCCGSGDEGCEYDVCEAISQAMSTVSQVVPRSRIAQLMAERALQKFRIPLEELISEGAFSRPAVSARPVEIAPTERIYWLGYTHVAWGHDQTAPEFTRRMLVITTRLRLVIVELPDASKLAVGQDISKADLAIHSVRELVDVKAMMVHPKMRQFICLWWHDFPNHFALHRELLIFESGAHQRQFREILRVVPRRKAKGNVHSLPPISRQVRGVSEVPFRPEVLEAVRTSVKKSHPRAEAFVVNMTFMKRADRQAPSTLMVLATDMIGVFDVREFFGKVFCESKEEDERQIAASEHAAIHLKGECLEDSDSDVEGMPSSVKDPGDAQSELVLAPVGGPWLLDSLQGIWFLADHEPKMKLQFPGKQQDYLFFNDGERQRWRQQLAALLEAADASQAAGAKNAWSVVPTEEVTMTGASKVIKEKEKDNARRQHEIEQLIAKATRDRTADG